MFTVMASVVLALLAVVAPVAATPAFSSFSLCYKLNGLSTQTTLDDPYAIAVELIGFYNTTLVYSAGSTYTAVGYYYQLHNLTGGHRMTLSRNGVTISVPVKALVAPNGFDFNNNWFYLNASQWVDSNGIAYNLSTRSEFPGKRYGTQVDLYRNNVYGPAFETVTSGTNTSALSQSLCADNILGWTGCTYTKGTCAPTPITSKIITNYTFTSGKKYAAHISYHLASTVRDTTQFTIDALITLTSQTFAVGNVDQFDDQYLSLPTLSTAGASGYRVYCYGSPPTCINSTINGTAATGAFGYADNEIFGYYPYLSYNGPAYTVSQPVPKPGFAEGHNETATVNIYFSQGGQFLEGFGSGGTGPSGQFNYSLTRYSLYITTVA